MLSKFKNSFPLKLNKINRYSYEMDFWDCWPMCKNMN